MSFFGPSVKYSQTEHGLPEIEIRKIISHFKIKSLSSKEEDEVEQSLINKRGADGKISMQQVYEVLLALFHKHKISKIDLDDLLNIFEDYFREHFLEQ